MQHKNKLAVVICLTITSCIMSLPVYAQYNNEPMQGAFELVGIMVLFLLVIVAFFRFLAYDTKKNHVTTMSHHKKTAVNHEPKPRANSKNNSKRK